MTTEDGVRAVLFSYADLKSARFSEGYELVNLIIDFEDAVSRAGLNRVEFNAVSITIQGGPHRWINTNALDSAIKKITKVFIDWDYDLTNRV
ncbi:hypothetical protein [Paenibacillus sp. CAA11]|uniref:hypothetical protein n=1 Tax=Paenibacillus sp. CAA11 TaxID=1532905 RepID=UPI00131F4133|nr:hypothetical protein [Paenibacillus sp. CAA11]